MRLSTFPKHEWLQWLCCERRSPLTVAGAAPELFETRLKRTEFPLSLRTDSVFDAKDRDVYILGSVCVFRQYICFLDRISGFGRFGAKPRISAKQVCCVKKAGPERLAFFVGLPCPNWLSKLTERSACLPPADGGQCPCRAAERRQCHQHFAVGLTFRPNRTFPAEGRSGPGRRSGSWSNSSQDG